MMSAAQDYLVLHARMIRKYLTEKDVEAVMAKYEVPLEHLWEKLSKPTQTSH